jgi:hypothetical protein
MLRAQECKSSMEVTNQDFFKHEMYFTDEVKTQLVN